MRRRFLLAALAVAAAVLPAPAARADVAWSRCTDPGFPAFDCGTVTVPIDPAGSVPGTINLFIRRLPAPANPNRVALAVLAGGPGQAASESANEEAVALANGLAERDLISFDQRGTGRSYPLSCGAIGRGGSPLQIAAGCANELGPQRAFFRTPESVEDLEAVRREGGYERLALFGTSYGTKVALAYAARYPERVDRLVLDSVVTPEGPDPLLRSSFAAATRVLRALCRGGLCRSATPDPVSDVRRLVARGRVRGRFVDRRGRRRTGVLAMPDLFAVLGAGDLNPAWRAQLPGAMRAAVRRDPAPLLRLAATVFATGAARRATGPTVGAQEPSGMVNEALYLTTVCEEVRFPWDRNAPAQTRIQQAAAALAAIPPAAFAPFDRATAAGASLVPLCAGWPNASPAPADPQAPTPVPALVLSGEGDLRTPAEDGAAVASGLGGTHVVIPHVGHSVLGSDVSGCARGAIAAFFRGEPVSPCAADTAPAVAPLRRPPRSLRELRPARGFRGRVGRTLTAIGATRDDALVTALGLELDGLARRTGAVRHGTIAITNTGVALRGVEYVPGVRVSGTFPDQGKGNTARLRITGRAAARGVVTLIRGGRVRGRIGGKRIRTKDIRAARSGGWGVPSERALAPFPGLRSP